MNEITGTRPLAGAEPRGRRMDIKTLAGSGERIGLLMLPFLLVGIPLNVMWPSVFSVGGPSAALRMLSIAFLVPGIVMWGWSVALILTKVPRHELITTGPFALVKHPLYTAVALLVLPWAGFLLNTWLGLVLGVVLYVGTRLFAPAEERTLAGEFGTAWDRYGESVLIPWL